LLIISIIIFVIAAVILGIAYFQHKKIQVLHFQNIHALEKYISENRNELFIRNENLNRYDFLKYNLVEALVVQENIILR